MTATLIVIGRLLLGVYFLQAGIRNFGKIPLHTGIIGKRGVPMPREALLVGLAVQVLGGLSVALSIFPAIGAVGLILFTIGATLLYHDFWRFPAEERMSHFNSFMTNLALIGGFLLVIATA
jgi:putative oxidoreductase